MERQYDLFERQLDGPSRWIDAADDLRQARRKLERLMRTSTGTEYFVRDFCSGTVVAVSGHVHGVANRHAAHAARVHRGAA
ncbi:MAG TPA: hypothetical protein VMT20_30315 [Terriglobia bacterium]|nr:hypothetical protein [Terriglobia bacterium]